MLIRCFSAQAQTSSENGHFQVAKDKLCQTEQLQITDGTGGNLDPDLIVLYGTAPNAGTGTDKEIIENFQNLFGNQTFQVGEPIPEYDADSSFFLLRILQGQEGTDKIDDRLWIAVTKSAPEYALYQCPSQPNKVVVYMEQQERALYHQVNFKYQNEDNSDNGSADFDLNKESLIVTAQTTGTYEFQAISCPGIIPPNKQVIEVDNNYQIPAVNGMSLTVTRQDTQDGAIRLSFPAALGNHPYISNWNGEIQIAPLNNITFTDLNTQEDIYSFTASPYDLCEEKSIGQSRSLHSIIIDATSEKGFNKIEINALNKSVDLQKNSTPWVKGVKNSIDDRDITCGTSYEYSASYSEAGNLSSHSVTTEKISGNTDKAANIAFVNANVTEDNLIEIDGDEPTQRAIYTITNGSSTISAEEHYFTYDQLNPQQQAYCFRSSLTDECNNLSNSIRSCTIFLSAEGKSATETQLQWSNYAGFKVSKYEVLLLNENNAIVEEEDAGPFPAFRINTKNMDPAISKLRIRAVGQNTNEEALSNIINLETREVLEFPNAFSPNGDGINDIFTYVGSTAVNAFELLIYNRWGEIIHQTKANAQELSSGAKKGWDGTFNGTKVPAGHYTYHAEITTARNNQLTFNGIIILIR